MPPVAVPQTGVEDARLAVRNAIKLSGSLLFTWTIALGVRLILPRALGPDQFGAFNFADAFTATFFVVLQLGVDVYARNEVARRPAHASDFLGGVLALRVLLGAAVSLGALLVARASGKSLETQHLIVALGLAQFLLSLGNTFAAVLHAAGRVDGLSVVNITSKLLWAAGVLGALATGKRLIFIAAAGCLAEGYKTARLWWLARRDVGLTLRMQPRATAMVLLASLPFFLNSGAQSIYQRIDVTVLSLIAGDREVGFYGAGANVAQLALLLTPLISWVLMPLYARAAMRSPEELSAALRRSMQLVLAVVVPAALGVALGAEQLVALLFGPAFAPAVAALRVLAPAFVLTYVGTVAACGLITAGQGWTVTGITVVSLLINPLLDAALIGPVTSLLHREGAGGVACALGMLTTEALASTALLVALRARTFDRAGLAALAKTLAACGAAIGVHLLAPLPAGALLPVDAAVFVAAALLLGAWQPRAVLRVAGMLLGRAHAPTA